MARKRKDGKSQAQFLVPSDLNKRFRIACVMMDSSVQEEALACIERNLQKVTPPEEADDEKTGMAIVMTDDLKTRLRSAAVMNGVSMSDQVTIWLQDFLPALEDSAAEKQAFWVKNGER